jgi:hypothetical protein
MPHALHDGGSAPKPPKEPQPTPLRSAVFDDHDHDHAPKFAPHEARQELRLRMVTGLVAMFFVLELIGAVAARSSVLPTRCSSSA